MPVLELEEAQKHVDELDGRILDVRHQAAEPKNVISDFDRNRLAKELEALQHERDMYVARIEAATRDEEAKRRAKEGEQLVNANIRMAEASEAAARSSANSARAAERAAIWTAVAAIVAAIGTAITAWSGFGR